VGDLRLRDPGRGGGGTDLATRDHHKLKVFLKYLAFELPGWLVAVLVLAALVHADQLSFAVASLLLGLWVLKDLVLFPLLRIAYEPGPVDATEALVGVLAVAQEEFSQSGYVRIGPELWRAELVGKVDTVPAGTTLRVRAVRGLTLLVERAPESEQETAP